MSNYDTSKLVNLGQVKSSLETVKQHIQQREDTNNKITSITSQSTDVQYPSAKAVYDLITNRSKVYYGSSNTAGNLQEKIATILNLTSLEEGTIIYVEFENGQLFDGVPSLNVNNLGAKTIKLSSSVNAGINSWTSGEFIPLIYDGQYWIMVDGVTSDMDSSVYDPTGAVKQAGGIVAYVANQIATIPTYEDGNIRRY